MSGPIVRTGTTPEFWKNYDRIFGDKKAAAGEKKAVARKSPRKGATAKKSAKKAAARKGAKKR